MRKFLQFVLLLVLFFLSGRPAYAQNDNHVFFVGNATQFASNVPANSFSGSAGQVYIFSPSPNTAVTFYVSNTSASSYNLTYQVFATGSPVVANYSANKLYWSGIPTWSTQGGYSTGPSVTATVPASGSISISCAQSNGAQIALALTGSSGTGAQIQNLTVVFAGNGAIPVTAVQGTTPTGSNAPVGNPVLLGAPTITLSAVHFFTGEVGPPNYFGLDLGGSMSVGTTGSEEFGFNSCCGLAVVLKAQSLGSNTDRPLVQSAISTTVLSNALLTTNAGVLNSDFNDTVTANKTVVLWALGQTSTGLYASCDFVAEVTGAVGGTTPTLDIYIQDSADGTNWNDRVHFTQATATNFFQEAGITSSVSMNPTTFANETLAATSVLNGPIAQFLRIDYKVGGTSPSFAGVRVYAMCQ